MKIFAFYLKNLQKFYFTLNISTDKFGILPPKVKKFKKISRTTSEPRGTVLAGENRPSWLTGGSKYKKEGISPPSRFTALSK